MYGKPKGNSVPSDVQAREKLAMYVYEYLLHVGASSAASTFLKEIGWEKQIAIGDSPGFLHSWWCVFWDLYCASPERRETCEHSPEAKAFHDYSAATAPSPLSSMPPDGMGQPGIPPGYFPPGSAASPSPHHNPNNPMMRQAYISPRYGGPRPGMQGPGPHQLIPGMEHSRQGQMMGINRMVHPRNLPPGMNPSWGGPEQFQQPFGNMSGMRMPSSGMPGPGGIPMSMHGRSPWNNPSGPGGPGGIPSSVGPGTPVLRSPQGHRPHMHPPHRYPMPHDPKNPDGLNPEFSHMGKPMSHPQMPSSFPMGNVPDNLPPTSSMPGGAVSTPNLPPQPLNPNLPPQPLNGMNGGTDGNMIDGIPKNSPNMPMNSIGGPASMGPPGGPGGTPHTPQEGDQDSFNQLVQPFNDNNESAAILKIKESMQMDAKLFEKDETREGGVGGNGGGAGGGEFNFLS